MNSQDLRSLLITLRETYDQEPPQDLELSLRSLFRRQRRERRMRKWGTSAMIATAAAVALLFVSLPKRQEPRRDPPSAALKSVTPTPQSKTQLATVVVPEHRAAPRRPRQSRIPQHPPTELDPGFYRIPYSEPLLPSEQVNVYRVELPRVTLAHYGLPMRPGTLDATITADVVVGSDGIARAIRFVP